MRHTAVFIAGLLCILIASATAATVVRSGLLSYNNQVVQSNGNGNQVTLAPINACDPSQLWVLDSDGFIYQQGNPNLVLDDQNSNPANGNPVIMWNKKSPNAPNQLWTVSGSGVATQLNGFYLRKSSTSQNVVISNNQPVQAFAFMDNPYPCPDPCASHGDPHFTSWQKTYFNYQSWNTVLWAAWNNTRVYTVQFPCNTGVTCNEGFVAHPGATNDTFQITSLTNAPTIAYYNKMPVNISMGLNSFGNFFNVTKFSPNAYQINFPGAYIFYGAYSWVHGTYVNLDVTLTGPSVIQPSLCVGPTAGQDPQTFGNQFIVANRSTTAYQYASTPYNYDPNYPANNGPFTTNDTALAQKAQSLCSIITSTPGYGSCNSLIAPDFYFGTCYNDTILTGLFLFAQMSIDAYADLCVKAAKNNGSVVITLQTSSTTTLIVGAATTLTVGTTTQFTIVAKDINANNRSVGGDNFTVTSTGPGMLTFTVVDNNDGTYTVTFTVTISGTYTISVLLNNASNVGGAPYNLTAIATTSASTSGLVIGPVAVGASGSFTIQARTPSGAPRTSGGDTFTLVYNTSVFSNVTDTDNGDGTYTVTFVVMVAGLNTINVQYNGTNIACSPYTVLSK